MKTDGCFGTMEFGAMNEADVREEILGPLLRV
jgi:hypothetical protein